MARGRPPNPGTAEEKAAARRERVRNNVRALRERRKTNAALLKTANVDQLGADIAAHVEQKGSVSDDRSDATVELDTHSSSNASFTHKNPEYSPWHLVRRDSDPRISFPISVGSRGPYEAALLGVMRQNFLPDSVYLPQATDDTYGKPWQSQQFLWTPCAFWVTSAFEKASSQEDGLLKTNILAIGMLMKSLEFDDASLKVAALDMYRRGLQGIHKSLEPLILDKTKRPQDTVSLYLSCHAAAMFELALNPDLSATMRHLRGVSQLICHLGDGRDEDSQSAAWLLLQDYRFAEMGMCLKYRYTSFSSMKRRQFEDANFSHTSLPRHSNVAQGHGSHNVLVRITDIADEISALMVQLDGIRPFLTRADAPVKVQHMLSHLGQIWIGYEDVHNRFRQHCGSNFIYKDKRADGPTSGSVQFKTFDIGAAWCYKLMTQCYCLDTMIDAMSMLLHIEKDFSSESSPASPDEQSESEDENSPESDTSISTSRLAALRAMHRKVCVQLTQSLQYFLQTDKGVTGQALAILPLDAAVGQLANELSRLVADLKAAKERDGNDEQLFEISKNIATVVDARDFCQTLQRRAEKFGLPSFTNAGTQFLDNLHHDEVVLGFSPHSRSEHQLSLSE